MILFLLLQGVLQGSLEGEVSFDPRSGFRLPISPNNDPTGIYVCTASFNNLYKLIEHTVTPKDSVRTSKIKSILSIVRYFV
jgi:hypothetical protein